jgi:hypothetical protein
MLDSRFPGCVIIEKLSFDRLRMIKYGGRMIKYGGILSLSKDDFSGSGHIYPISNEAVQIILCFFPL